MNKGIILLYSLLLIPLAVSVYILLVSTLPFKPYTWISYEPIPTEACPGDSVTVMVDRKIDTSYTLSTIEINGYWVEGSTGISAGDVSAIVPITGEEGRVVSSAFRAAPLIEGEWYPKTKVEVKGKVLGWPRTQIVEPKGDIPLMVRGCEDD